jgi:cullin 3
LQEIKDATTIVDHELQRHLQSLACAKFKILKKHPPSRDINTEDSFSFNDDFTSTMQKVKINTVSSKVESSEERRETRDRIDEERKHQIEVFHIFFFWMPKTESGLLGMRCAHHEGSEASDA